ncbi:hypothetical protein MNBD_ALPHA06-644 [hydrothermal vent metagenome]|uniref:DM13 domain-containing protein n=1 Tax=hydrothermal vent metagenome TaxID=652676 RepID=A0A3B0RQ58_9ZZZZ
MRFLTLSVTSLLLGTALISACSEEQTTAVSAPTPVTASKVETKPAALTEAEIAAEANRVAQEKLAAETAAAAQAQAAIDAAASKKLAAEEAAEARKLTATRAEFDQKRREAEAAFKNAEQRADAQRAAQAAAKALAAKQAAAEQAAKTAAAEAEQAAKAATEQAAKDAEIAKARAYALRDRVIAQGTFTKKKKSINGGWSIVMQDGKRYLRFDDGFKTKWVDDLQVFLSPQGIAAANGKNAGQDVYRLAPLTAKKGAQEYAIPDEVDLDIYKSILIHCEEYNLLWGGTDIR